MVWLKIILLFIILNLKICKLIDVVNNGLTSSPKLTIKSETLSEWIISERILSLAVEG